jgi:hypothetical protein
MFAPNPLGEADIISVSVIISIAPSFAKGKHHCPVIRSKTKNHPFGWFYLERTTKIITIGIYYKA